MNDRDFDAFLRETLRTPAPSNVPVEVRAVEIERVVTAVFDELAWGDDTGGLDDDRQDDDAQRSGLHAWDDAATPDAWESDDDPLPSFDTLESDDRDFPHHGTLDFNISHDDIGHGDTGHPGTDDQGLDES